MLEVMDLITCRCKVNLPVEDYLEPIQFNGGGLADKYYEEVAGTSKQHVYDSVAEEEPDVFYMDDEIYKKTNENVESRMYDEVEYRCNQSFENIYCTIISNSNSSEKNSNSSQKNSNLNSASSWGTEFDCSSEHDDCSYRASRIATWFYGCCCAAKRVTTNSRGATSANGAD